jgi:predicted nucleic acid-binding protein
LAKELATLFLANDQSAISIAKQYHIETKWVTEILHDAMKANHIKSVKEYTKILDDCVKNGLYVSKKQREKAIQKARYMKT